MIVECCLCKKNLGVKGVEPGVTSGFCPVCEEVYLKWAGAKSVEEKARAKALYHLREHLGRTRMNGKEIVYAS